MIPHRLPLEFLLAYYRYTGIAFFVGHNALSSWEYFGVVAYDLSTDIQWEDWTHNANLPALYISTDIYPGNAPIVIKHLCKTFPIL